MSAEHLYEHLALDPDGELLSYDHGIKPSRTVDQMGQNIHGLIAYQDQIGYDFNGMSTADQFSQMHLSFDRSELADQSQLIINARQSQWLEYTIDHFYGLMGERYSQWAGQMNKGNIGKYEQTKSDKGITLNAYLWQNDDWTYIGHFKHAGTAKNRTLSLPVDLSNSKGEVRIKLETGYKFWSIDQVTLTSTFSKEVALQEVPMEVIFRDEPVDNERLATADEKYIILTNGESVRINIGAVSPNAHLILQSVGYYESTKTYLGPAQTKLLREMKRDDHSAHQLSRLLEVRNQLARIQP